MEIKWVGNNYIPGTNNAICDICGFKFKASELRYNYNGLLVCSKDWEPRHPQELIRHRTEKIKADKVRPRQTETTLIYATRVTQDDL